MRSGNLLSYPRQGSPYLDYEQLVLNSNKEGMDFLRKGQYKQGEPTGGGWDGWMGHGFWDDASMVNGFHDSSVMIKS